MPTARRFLFLALVTAILVGVGLAQPRFDRGFWGEEHGPIVRTEGGQLVNEDTVRTARETAPHSVDLPGWTNAPGFEKDVFTFTRILFKSPGRPAWVSWLNDYPDADLNLSARLKQLTSITADPDGRVVRLTDPALAEYPFIFMSHPEWMELRDEEITGLRNYLFNGGALFADDFWGDQSWAHFEAEMRKVLPHQSWTELTISNQLFHCVFDLRGSMNSLQVPSIHF